MARLVSFSSSTPLSATQTLIQDTYRGDQSAEDCSVQLPVEQYSNFRVTNALIEAYFLKI